MFFNPKLWWSWILIQIHDINYDIIAISESRIMRNLEVTKNINIKNYNMEYKSTESTAGWAVMYSKPSSIKTKNQS